MSTEGPSAVRVFLLDDHEVVRRGLADLLDAEADIEVVGDASTVAEAERRLPATRPDVAVLDARLPDGSGVEFCRHVTTRWPEVRCLILTSYDDADALFAAVLGGASGYLLKEVRGGTIVEAVREVAAGRSLLDPVATARLLQRLRSGAARDPRLDALNDREREILDHIAAGRTNREIAAEMFLAEKTIKNYVSSLLAKLGMQRRTQVAVFGHEVGRRGSGTFDPGAPAPRG